MNYNYVFNLLGSLVLLFNSEVEPQRTIYVEVLTGRIYNVPSKLIIRQEGYETIRRNAMYSSKSFQLPPYYDFRLSLLRNDSSAFGVKFIHHKRYLTNTTNDSIDFEITHGYTILSLTRI